MELTVPTVLIAFAGVFLICFMKGAFGGGFSIVGIPLLSFVMDPVTAGGFSRHCSSRWTCLPCVLEALDLVETGPCVAVARAPGRYRARLSAVSRHGPSCGSDRDGDGHPGLCRPVACRRLGGEDNSALVAEAIAGGLAGITTMVAHSGGPPLAMYLLPLGLSKEVYAGTTSLFFTVGNATKAVPWLLLVRPTGNVWILMATCLLAIPSGVWLGWRLHGSLDQRQIFRACYGLLVVTALKLLWDGVSGYLG